MKHFLIIDRFHLIIRPFLVGLIQSLITFQEDIINRLNELANVFVQEHHDFPNFRRLVFEVMFAPDQVPVMNWVPNIEFIENFLAHFQNWLEFLDQMENDLYKLLYQLAPTLSDDPDRPAVVLAQTHALNSIALLRDVLFYFEAAHFILSHDTVFRARNMTNPFSDCIGLFSFFTY